MVIVAPLDGSPAEAAGLRAGDQVLAIDGTSTVGESVSSLVYQVRGEAGTDVTLTVRRDDEELDITITRAVIDLQEVEREMLEAGIGYIRLTSFTDRAPGLFRDALAGPARPGRHRDRVRPARQPRRLHLHRRGDQQRVRPGRRAPLHGRVRRGGPALGCPTPGGLLQTDAIEVVLLIDEGSASASEIVAGALEETGRATLVGQPTFGKNTVQVWNDLPNGGGLRITTDRWFTPEHNSAAPDGIQPDVVVAAPEDPASRRGPSARPRARDPGRGLSHRSPARKMMKSVALDAVVLLDRLVAGLAHLRVHLRWWRGVTEEPAQQALAA